MIIYTHLGKPFDILLIDQLLLLHFAVCKGGLVPGAQWIMIIRANPNKQSSCGDCVAGMMWIQLDKCNRSIIWRNSRPVEWPLVPCRLRYYAFCMNIWRVNGSNRFSDADTLTDAIASLRDGNGKLALRLSISDAVKSAYGKSSSWFRE